MGPLRLLFATPEIFPLSKTGGLGDVSASLPRALAELGVDVRIITPAYPSALAAAKRVKVIAPLDRGRQGRLLLAETPDSGLPVYLVDAPGFYQREGGPYQDETSVDWPDNASRFNMLCRAAVSVATGIGDPRWSADIVHANDWPTGLIPAMLRRANDPRTVFTIHNLAFQGLFPPETMNSLDIDRSLFSPDGLEFYGKLSFLKGGVCFADRVTTVSPGYAREILTAEHGCGLEGALRVREKDLVGILNGVDTEIWNPARDPIIPATFHVDDLSGKLECKRALQTEYGLNPSADAPVFASVSRLTEQKMANVVLDVVPDIIAAGGQFVLIGAGDRHLEEAFLKLAAAHPGQVAIRIGYEEPAAHRILAGADILLSPARFEPCGLSAMYGCAYGTPPIGRRTGGLAATIIDTTPETIRNATATGFLFDSADAGGLREAVHRALEAFQRPVFWRHIQLQGMKRDLSWASSASRYIDMYSELVAKPAVPMVGRVSAVS